MYRTSPENAFRSEEGEAVTKVKLHLFSKQRDRSGPGTVTPRRPMLHDLSDKIEILILLMSATQTCGKLWCLDPRSASQTMSHRV